MVALNRSQTRKARAIPLEMLTPFVAAWMEEPEDSPRAGITPRDVPPFVVVAEETSQRQIPGGRLAVVFARNDVVNLKGEVVVFLRHLAVFTDVPGTTPHHTFEASVHSNVQ